MGLHVGVVGSGAWSRVHLAAHTASRAVDQVTLVGRNETALAERAAEFGIVERVTTRLEHILDDETIDVVDIVLPHHLHAATAIAALESGKHVICEKPAAIRLDDFDRVVSAAREAQRQFLVVMDQLYNPVVLRTRDLIDEGALGRTFLAVEHAYSNASKNYRDPAAWRTTLAGAGGGILIDGAYHMVYKHLFCLAKFGAPAWVSADVAQLAVNVEGHPDPARGEDTVAITVGFNDAVRIHWSHGWTLAATPLRDRMFFFAGTRATLEIDYLADPPLTLRSADGAVHFTVQAHPRASDETVQACLVDMTRFLGEDGPPPRATLELARRALQVILGAYEASRTGSRVLLGS